MYSKRILGVFIVAIALFTSCKKGDRKFSIEGSFAGMPVQTVILEQLNANDVISIIDSERTDANGHFKINSNGVEPGLYRLHFIDNHFILLSIDRDNVSVSGAWPTIENYSVTGSLGSENLKTFIVSIRQHLRDVNTMSVVIDSLHAQGKDSLLTVAKKEFEDMRLNFTAYVEHYADTTRFEPNAIFAARLLNSSKETDFLSSFAQTLDKRFANTRMTREFMEYYHKVASQGQQPKSINQHVDVGFPAPEIKAATPDGGSLALSSLRGKYVLVDFWASWCRPCRLENPNVVKAYNTYKDKNFTVLSVSLDNKHDDWVKAINDDKLTWNHVSDLKGWNSEAAATYGIQSIPFNFLLDTSGKVIARDLRGEQLEDILRQFIK